MKKTLTALLALTAVAFAGTALAKEPSCNVPKEKWMKEADFRTLVEGQGYKIKTFKVNSGKCYEVYGTDSAGKKVEVFFNPETGEQIK